MIDENTTRIDREKNFHDARFSLENDDKRSSQKKYYNLIKECINKYQRRVYDLSVNADVLEYGCSEGKRSLELAPTAKSVVGIDISSVAIDHAQDMAQKLGVTNAKFYAMNAESMNFSDHQFDLVFGSGILHHLNLEKALPEIRRVLKPGGRVVFIEPMGLNPIINIYRFITPSARTVDEHPLIRADFRNFSKQFPETDYHFFGFASLFSIFFFNSFLFPTALRFFSLIDIILFKIPFIRWFAWYSLLEGKSSERTT